MKINAVAWMFGVWVNEGLCSRDEPFPRTQCSIFRNIIEEITKKDSETDAETMLRQC